MCDRNQLVGSDRSAFRSGEALGDGSERRRHPRLKCKGIAEMRVISTPLKMSGKVADLSVCGCCLEFEAEIPLEPIAAVEVQLCVRGITVQLAGVLRRVVGGHRAGIEFDTLSQRKQLQICEMMDELFELDEERHLAVATGSSRK